MSGISVSIGRTRAGDLSSTLILALGTFVVGADAFVIAGFLPSVADALHVSTADGRQSITLFVVAYAVLAPVLAMTTAHVPRRVLMISALLVLGVANLVSALAPTLPVLIAGRMLAAAGAAAYTPIAAAVFTSLVRPRCRVPALFGLLGGMAAATTMGLALGEFAGRWLGWRAALGAVALVCLVAGVGVLLTLPWLPGRPRPGTPTHRLGTYALLSITVLGIVVGYGAYAYVIPALAAIGIPDATAVLVLFVYGLGAMFVNAVTGLRPAVEERRRIARELHDSLTHDISLIKVQAGIAVHLARQRGEPVPASLLAIQEASTDAMRELRATLGTLRDQDDEPSPSGLDRLGDLVDRARSAGLPAALTISGERPALPAEVERTAYRIIQEALTNTARHAGNASALVQISYRPDTLSVRIDDDGRATPDAPPEPGIGLTGMRERVTALGGRLHAGPRCEGGFTVQAELPLRTRHSGVPHRSRPALVQLSGRLG
ncbi:MFS transporter [Actinomadura sp. DC4]|uniref:sensor histidine kinase n=1 Tax=Actinomadura sp. DC4 TaxID=3055069 RepID=UPI0025AF78A5|nr:MFS transporter [Actinomadura sp. DC4]MDN3359219.1 MFS transporter [Actinomadura sp. DC4]